MPDEFDVKTTVHDVAFWAGLGKQVLNFEFAIAEFIDNAISATTNSEAFLIEILFEKEGRNIKVQIGDNASGMTKRELQNEVMKIGGKGRILGELNEHGFGFKNAISMLTQNKIPFRLYSATSDLNEEEVVKIQGKFPLLKGNAVPREEWDGNFEQLSNSRGTRIFLTTTFDYLKSVYSRARTFETAIHALTEHVGVIYRGYLRERRHNQIFIGYKIDDNWTRIEIPPIETPYMEKDVDKKIEFEINGEKYISHLIVGEIDDTQRNAIIINEPVEIRRKQYFQGVTSQAGIDIIKGGRVLIPHTFRLVWDAPQRHPEQRSVIGELLLDNKISTVNNKTSVNIHDEAWVKLRHEINKKEHKPKKKGPAAETDLRESLLKILKASSEDMGAKVFEHLSFWNNITVDLTKIWNDDTSEPHQDNADKYVIYEIKRTKSEPINLYQLIMYWDSLASAGKKPYKGYLVALDHTPSVIVLKDYLRTRKDANDNLYDIKLKKHADFEIE